MRSSRDGNPEIQTHSCDVRVIVQSEVKTSRSIELKSQPGTGFGHEGMPILSSRAALYVEGICSKRTGQRDVETNVSDGMAIGHIAMRSYGTFSWANYPNARECLVTINNLLWLALAKLVTIRVEHITCQSFGMQEGNDMGCDKRVEASVEGTAFRSILERRHESGLVFGTGVLQVELG